MNGANPGFPPVTRQPQLTADRASDSTFKCPDGVVSKWVLPVGGATVLSGGASALCCYCVAGFKPVGAYLGGPVGAIIGAGISCLYAAGNDFKGTDIREREVANYIRMDTFSGELQPSQGRLLTVSSSDTGNSYGSCNPVQSQPGRAAVQSDSDDSSSSGSSGDDVFDSAMPSVFRASRATNGAGVASGLLTNMALDAVRLAAVRSSFR
ncbi:hypothetical protein [Endozoicomonas sp. 8E]|uniref:hypothetical protein n=1 Tax=Endozoicomonas sp. 8E TaxID=3035692 RepID=UPI0029390275|nr:hypothetical protein [Endozoicomonas sp. 8E]WOG27717.1 hypothetical protein P6910_24740 [Endozoicomonas sp. 8E]